MQAALARVVVFVLRSTLRIRFAIACAAILFGLFEFVVARWCLRADLAPNLQAALQACIVGSGAGIALWIGLLGIVERRRLLADQLRRVAKLNHVVRNCLELIVLAECVGEDHDHKAIVLECTQRIEQPLRELFPITGKRGNGKS